MLNTILGIAGGILLAAVVISVSVALGVPFGLH
jgi:hypothetical protein